MLDSDDEEYTLEAYSDRKKGKMPARLVYTEDDQPLLQAEDGDASDLEAPTSLLVEQPHAPTHPTSTREHMTIHDRTMWRWTNVENMDDFFQRVYAYYQGKGMYCILLSRLLNLLTLGFVIFFSSFLVGCVNYSEIPHHHSLSEVIVPQCYSKLSFSTWLFMLIFIAWWGWQAVRFVLDWPGLKEMHNFYHHLLHIPDEDMQTVAWQKVLQNLVDIRETNPNTSRTAPIRLNELDVSSRIMRKENYLVALFNKDILNITVPLPYLRTRQIFTRDLEWNFSFCVLSYVFDQHGQIRKRFLKEKNRPLLVAGLRRRFIFMGLLNLLFAPFIFAYLVVFFFFRYFEEYHKNPGEIGSRTYTPFAKWKFREFNELPHLLRARVCTSYPDANKYIDQFPKEKTALFARFVAFVAGSFAGVLAVFTLLDSEALLNFEISANGSVLFYLGIFSTLFAVSRGMIPDEHLVFEPERMLKQVVEHTHYFPSEWRGKLHTDEVRAQFCRLFDYKVSIFLQELLSVVFTPIVLIWSLPLSAESIVDFFREFTVHVEGLGYVCSFSQFDFARHGNVKYGAPTTEPQDEYYLSKEGKMEKSFLNFKANNPTWTTGAGGSLYLSRLTEFQQQKTHFEEMEVSSMAGEQETSDDEGDQGSSNSPSYQRHTFSSPADKEPLDRRAAAMPMRVNSYGVPEGRIPSNLGDSFAGTQRMTWQQGDEGEEPGERHPHAGMLGLLNNIYDLSNNPNV